MSRRRAFLLVAGGLLIAYGGASIRNLPAGDRAYVLDGRLLPVASRAVSPGWRLVPFLLARVSVYPAGPRTLRADLSGASAAVSREGARVEIESEIRYAIPSDRLLDLHRLHGPRYEASWLAGLLRRATAASVRAVSYDLVRNRDPELLRSLREALAAETDPAGLRVQTVLLAPVAEPGAGSGAILRAGIEPLGRAIVIVGVDSFDWRILDPLLRRGLMPNVARLVARGARANLKTIRPILSPVIWTSIATGMRPSRHGIVDFVVNAPGTGELVPVTSAMRQVPALWSLVSRQGLDVDVVAWWATWPAEPVQGRIVTDRVAFQLFGRGRRDEWKNADADAARGKTFPPGLFETIRPLIVAPDEVSDAEIAPFLGGRVPAGLDPERRGRIDDLRTVVAAAGTYHRAALELLQPGRPALTMLYYQGPDEVSHLFMRYRPPQLPGVGRADMDLFGVAVDRYYRHQDRLIGEIVERAGPDALILIVSDHGFKVDALRPHDSDPRIGGGNAAEWHTPIGVLVAAGPDIRKGFDLGSASILDVTPTVLALFGLPVARDMDGQPLTEMMTETFLRRRPIAWVDSYGGTRRPGQAGVAPSGEDAELVEKLRNLGYIGEERVTARNNRGMIALDEGDVDGAIAEFEAALDTGDAGTLLRTNLARAWMVKGDRAKARMYAERALADEPGNKQAMLLLGGIAMKDGVFDEAEGRFRRILEIDPAFTPARSRLGELLHRRGDLEQALGEFRRVVAIAPLSPVEFNSIGNIHRERGRIDPAMEAYREALRCDAQYIGAYNNLGLLLQDRGRLDEARALYGKALAIRPENPILRNSLGTLLALKGDRDGALAEFGRAVAADPGWPVPQANLAALLFEAGRTDEARAAFRRWVDLEPASTEARLGSALAHLMARDTDAAVAEFRKVLELDPGNFRAHVGLGEILIRRDDLEAARRHLEAAARIDGAVPRVHNGLGEVYARLGLARQAAEAYRKSLLLDAGQAAIRQRLREIAR